MPLDLKELRYCLTQTFSQACSFRLGSTKSCLLQVNTDCSRRFKRPASFKMLLPYLQTCKMPPAQNVMKIKNKLRTALSSPMGQNGRDNLRENPQIPPQDVTLAAK